jgi:hypothetical protein
MTNDRPDLSSERAPHRDKTAIFRQQPSDRKKYLDIQADWPSVVMWLRLRDFDCSEPSSQTYKSLQEDHGIAVLPCIWSPHKADWRCTKRIEAMSFTVLLYGCETLSYIKTRSKMSANRVLRRIFELKRDNTTWDWRKEHIENIRNLYCL